MRCDIRWTLEATHEAASKAVLSNRNDVSELCVWSDLVTAKNARSGSASADQTDLSDNIMVAVSSVTRLGDLLNFGQLFKACGNNYFAKIATFLSNFWKGVNIFHFSSEIILRQLFTGHTGGELCDVEWRNYYSRLDVISHFSSVTCFQFLNDFIFVTETVRKWQRVCKREWAQRVYEWEMGCTYVGIWDCAVDITTCTYVPTSSKGVWIWVNISIHLNVGKQTETERAVDRERHKWGKEDLRRPMGRRKD